MNQFNTTQIFENTYFQNVMPPYTNMKPLNGRLSGDCSAECVCK